MTRKICEKYDDKVINLKRPVLRYHGGKWRIAPWIIKHFPAHNIYVEPFGGGGSVLMRKARVKSEIYNDLDEEIVNVFRVMQNKTLADELARVLYFTPYSRDEFYLSYQPDTCSLERARRTIIRSFMGFGSNAVTRKSRHGFRTAGGGHTPSIEWVNYPEQIRLFIERLRGTVIENKDALSLMRQYDDPHVLHYVDPPYLASLREKSHATSSYRYEMTDADHVKLCECLQGLKGYVILSGYENEIYNKLLIGWQKVCRFAMAEKAKRTTETLWINPETFAALQGRLI